MTDTLKTVLVTALNASLLDDAEADLLPRDLECDPADDWDMILIEDRRGEDAASINADRLATAIREHFLNREKVKAAVTAAINGSLKYGNAGVNKYGFSSEWDCEWDFDDLIDRLIEGLSR